MMEGTLPGKASEIQSLLAALLDSDLARRLEIVDNWAADRHAIGFASRDRKTGLLYVSSWSQPTGRFAWALESPSGRTAREGSADDVEALIGVIRRLLLSPSSDSRRTA